MRRLRLRGGAGGGMKNGDVYKNGAFFNLQDFKKSGQGEMKKMDMTGGLRRFLQIASRALIVIKEIFFRVEEVGKGCDEKEKNKNGQVENFLFLVNHAYLKYNKRDKECQFPGGSDRKTSKQAA